MRFFRLRFRYFLITLPFFFVLGTSITDLLGFTFTDNVEFLLELIHGWAITPVAFLLSTN
jgi:hypothetical protein